MKFPRFPRSPQTQRQVRRYPLFVLALTCIASAVFYFALNEFVPQQESVRVAVLTTAIPQRHAITEADFEWRITDAALVPDSAFRESDGSPVGYVSLVPQPAGLVLTQVALVSDADPDSVSPLITEAGVAFRIPKQWLQNGLPAIAVSDRIDIYISAGGTELNATTILLDAIEIIDVEGEGDTTALVVQLTRKQAAQVSAAAANQLFMTLSVHGAAAE